MIFSCFRPRKKEETLPRNATKAKDDRKRKSQGKGEESNLKTTHVPIKVKLAPRSAILHTPKQQVGARISEATLQSRRGRLPSRDEVPEQLNSQNIDTLQNDRGSNKESQKVPTSDNGSERMSIGWETRDVKTKDKKPESIKQDKVERANLERSTCPIPAPPIASTKGLTPNNDDQHLEESTVTRPKSPTGLRPLFAGQQDELRAALARRAAKSSSSSPPNNNES